MLHVGYRVHSIVHYKLIKPITLHVELETPVYEKLVNVSGLSVTLHASHVYTICQERERKRIVLRAPLQEQSIVYTT